MSILVIQWNAEIIEPRARDIAAVFTSHKGLSVEGAEVLVITLQENVRLLASEADLFGGQVKQVLNLLLDRKGGTDADDGVCRDGQPCEVSRWNYVGYVQLGNWRPTKLRRLFYPNTQTLFVFVRQPNAKLLNFCRGSKSGSEKGFVGAILDLKDRGNLLVVGLHFSKNFRSSESLSMTFREIETKCVPTETREKKLDYFTAGVLLAGDFNTRVSRSDFERIAGSPVETERLAQRILSGEAQDLNSQQGGGSAQTSDSSPPHFSIPISPALLWAVDQIGGSRDDASIDLRRRLRKKKFFMVANCYASSITYPLKKGCKAHALQSRARELTGSSFLALCAENEQKVRSELGFGNLDRLVIRDPTKGAFIVERGVYMSNTRSDHMILGWSAMHVMFNAEMESLLKNSQMSRMEQVMQWTITNSEPLIQEDTGLPLEAVLGDQTNETISLLVED